LQNFTETAENQPKGGGIKRKIKNKSKKFFYVNYLSEIASVKNEEKHC
jgi:hypothetical protein